MYYRERNRLFILQFPTLIPYECIVPYLTLLFMFYHETIRFYEM